jgi:hypothetical protein
MKIFDPTNSFRDKLNFVDKNNVVLGFDFSQDCCEDFGYYFSLEWPATRNGEVEKRADELEPYVFDPTFFGHGSDEVCGEGGGDAVFKLVDGDKVLYLVIYNHHNGYYGHGFEFKNGDKVIEGGCL